MNCPNCGTQYENSDFCPNCGAPAPVTVDVQAQYYEQIPNDQQYEQSYDPQQQYDPQIDPNYAPQQSYAPENPTPKKSKVGIILAFVAVAIVAAIIGGFIGSAITKNKLSRSISAAYPSTTSDSYNYATSSDTQGSASYATQNTVIYDKDSIKITYTGIKLREYTNTPEICFLIENDTKKAISVDINTLSIDGYSVSGMMLAEIEAGKKSNTSARIYSSDIENNNLDSENLKDIEISFSIREKDDYSSKIKTDTFELPNG